MEFEVAHECVDHSCAVYVEPLSQTYVDQLVKKVKIGEIRHDVRQVNHSLKWYGLEGGNYIDAGKLTELDLKQCGEKVCDDTKNPVGYDFDRNQEYVSLDVQGKMTVNNKEYDINKKYNFVIELISAPVISGKCNDENVCVFSVTKDSEGGEKPYSYYWYDGYQNVGITSPSVDNGDFKYELKDNLKHSIVMSTGDKFGRNYSEDSNEVVVYADMYKAPTVEILSEDAVDEGKEALLAAEAVAYGNKTIQKDGYNWTVPEGWEIVSGQGTNLLVVKVPGYSKDMPKGKFSVVATDSEGIESNVATKEVAVLFDSSLKPATPSLLAADLNGQKDVVENTKYTVTANATASDGRKIVGYEWKVNGTRIKTTTNVFEQLAPSFNVITDNKIRVTVVAIDDGGVRSDESAEISIDVKADSSLKPTTLSLSAADLNGQKDVVENTKYKVTATVQAGAGRKIEKYEWNINGTKVETETNILEETAPAFNAIADNTIKVTVVAIDSAGVRSEESAEIGIAVKADSSLKPTTLSLSAADLNGQKDVVENTKYTVTANATASDGRKIVGYEWKVNGTKIDTKTNVLEETAPAFNAIADNKIRVTVVAIDDGGVRSEESAEIAIAVKADSTNKPTTPSLLAADLNGQKDVVENTKYTVTANATASDGRKIVGYEWKVNGTRIKTTTNVFKQLAPSFNVITDNKIRVTVVAIDDGGVRSDESAEISIDIKADSSISGPTNAAIEGKDEAKEGTQVQLTGSAKLPVGRVIKAYEWRVDGGETVTTETANFTFTARNFDVDKESQSVSLVVVDSVGKKSQAVTKNVKITIDNTISGPTGVQLTAPTQAKEGAPVTLTASATVANGRKIKNYTWTVGDQTRTTTDPSYQITMPSYDVDNPNLKVKVKVTDSANKTAESSESTIGITADTTIAGPTNAAIEGKDEAKEGTDVALTAKATVANGRVIKAYKWTVDGGETETTTTANFTFTARSFDASKESQSVSLVVVDSANKESKAVTKNVKITIDNTISGPTGVQLTAPTQAKEGAPVTLTASATVANGRKIKNYTWTVGDQTRTTTDPSYQITMPSYDVDNPNLKVKVKVTDSANKTAESSESTIGITADTTIAGPTNAAIEGKDEAKEGTDVALTAKATVANGRVIKAYKWTVDGGETETTTTANFTFTARSFDASKESQSVSLVVVDSANKESKAVTKNVKITIDNTISGPTGVQLTAPTQAKEGAPVTLTASATVANGRKIKNYTWTVGDQTRTTTDPSYQITMPSYDVDNPNLKVKVKVTDSANKTAESSESTIGITADTTIAGPTNAAIEGKDEAKEGTDVALTAKATVANGRVIKAYKWTVDGGKPQTTTTKNFTFTARSFDASKENQSVSLVVVDSANKESKAVTKNVKITIDNTISGPTGVQLTAPTQAKEGAPVTLTASATVANGRKIKNYTWTVGDQTRTTTDPSYQITMPSYDVDNPNLKVKVKVTDSANKTAESSESTIGITADTTIAGPTNAAIEGKDEAKEGTDVALTAKATVANGRVIKAYKWTVDGGKPQTTTTKNFTFTARSFDASKENQSVSLVVVDSANKESKAVTKNVKITANPAIPGPTNAAIKGADQAQEGAQVTLEAEATVANGRVIKAYKWTVDGGKPQTTTTKNFTFTARSFDASKENQSVSLVVVDSAGKESRAVTKNVKITANPAIPGPTNVQLTVPDAAQEGSTITLRATADAAPGRKIVGYTFTISGTTYESDSTGIMDNVTIPIFNTPNGYGGVAVQVQAKDSAGKTANSVVKNIRVFPLW
ncbi:hypothetical lipoprotein [Francisella cf. novicida Fx1]|nr:hypothetical lipoprotein [Francisella cf. novicida Fx1]